MYLRKQNTCIGSTFFYLGFSFPSSLVDKPRTLSPMRYLVRENLFLGNICAAGEILQNGSSEISSVVSVLPSASISIFAEWRNLEIETKDIAEVYVGDHEEHGSESSLPSCNLLYSLEYAGKDLKVKRMAVVAEDDKWENLLDYFDVCLDFIDAARKEGGVLVHCYAGQSRSASIITAYLMRSEQLSLEDALASLRQSCEKISPNSGFLEQLQLFESMNFKVNRTCPIYKRFRLRFLGYLYKQGKKVDRSKLRADPGVLPREGQSERMYCCKKCQRVLFLQEHVMDHTPGETDTELEWCKVKGKGSTTHGKHMCTSIFVEPLSWMTQVVDNVSEGKLSCAQCNARLGSFKWLGSTCSCGNKVMPAFQLHLSRLDVHAHAQVSTVKHVKN